MSSNPRTIFFTALKWFFVIGTLIFIPICFVLPLVLPFSYLLSFLLIAFPLVGLSIYVTRKLFLHDADDAIGTPFLVKIIVFGCLYLFLTVSLSVQFVAYDSGVVNKIFQVRKAGSKVNKIRKLGYSFDDKKTLIRNFVQLKFYEFFPFPPGLKKDVLGFEVNAYNHLEFSYLFNEVFVDQSYLFKPKNDQPVILDCGSNIGMPMLFFKHLYPKAKIISFEPDQRTFNILKKNVEENNIEGVELVNKALSDKIGTIRFSVDDDSSLTSSSYREGFKKWYDVETAKLSDYINDDVDFIKMDVEGAEGPILLDLIKNDKMKYIDQMIIEFHHNTKVTILSLSEFLRILDREGFDYQLSAPLPTPFVQDTFQDVLIYAYRK